MTRAEALLEVLQEGITGGCASPLVEWSFADEETLEEDSARVTYQLPPVGLEAVYTLVGSELSLVEVAVDLKQGVYQVLLPSGELCVRAPGRVVPVAPEVRELLLESFMTLLEESKGVER